MATNRAKPSLLYSIDSASITGTYQNIVEFGVPISCFYMRIVNDSNKSITVSLDAAVDQLYIPAGDTFEVYTQSNALPQDFTCLIQEGTMVYVKGEAGTGTVAVMFYYQERN